MLRMRLHYALWLRLEGADTYALWFSNDVDGVYVLDGRVPCFPTRDAARAHASARGLAVGEEEPILHDIDVVARWIAAGSVDVPCDAVLCAWNLFEDLARSSGDEALAATLDGHHAIYEKLFWGNNLPAVTPRGERFVPRWDTDELDTMRTSLRVGIATLVARMERR